MAPISSTGLHGKVNIVPGALDKELVDGGIAGMGQDLVMPLPVITSLHRKREIKPTRSANLLCFIGMIPGQTVPASYLIIRSHAVAAGI